MLGQYQIVLKLKLRSVLRLDMQYKNNGRVRFRSPSSLLPATLTSVSLAIPSALASKKIILRRLMQIQKKFDVPRVSIFHT